MSRPRPSLQYSLAIACLFLLPLSARVAAGQPATPGWADLWSNRDSQARGAFRAALKSNPADLGAMRGLGVLALHEDSRGEAVAAWSGLYRVNPGHWSATAYWPRFVENVQATAKWAVLDAAARDILASKGSAGELRASARLVQAAALERAGKAGEADRVYSGLGFIRRWRMIGPFDNVSGSGFDKALPPEREIALQSKYAGKDDLRVGWLTQTGVMPDGECPVGRCLGDADAAVFYAVTAVQAPADQRVAVSFDPDGASKVFVNGRLLFSDSVPRERQPLVADPFRFEANLHRGWNTILVKLASEQYGVPGFSLRVTGSAGEDLPTLGAEPARAQSAPAPEPGLHPAAPEITYAAAARKAADAGDVEAAAAVSYVLSLSGDDAGAVEIARKAVERRPECAWLRWELAEALHAEGQVDEAHAERDRARAANPRLVAAELEYLEEEEEAMNPAERLRRLKALLKSHPQSAAVRWALCNAYVSADLDREGHAMGRGAAAAAPGPNSWEALAEVLEGDPRQALGALDAGLKITPNVPSLLASRASFLQMSGNSAGAAAVYERIVQRHPLIYHLTTLAEMYEQRKDKKRAVAALRRARALRPQDSGVCSQLADLLRHNAGFQEAVGLYREAIRLDPSRVSLREKLQVLTKEQPVIDLAAPTPAAPLLAKAPKPGELPGVSAVTLLDEGRRVVYPDYAVLARNRLLIRVLDVAGAQAYQQIPLTSDSAQGSVTVESARVIKANGKVQTVSRFQGEEGVAFPSLAAGDTIDLTWREERFEKGGLARQFWTAWNFSERGVPRRLCRLVLITPPGMQYQTRAHGQVPEPVETTAKGWLVREWKLSDLPAEKDEPGAPPRHDTATWLDISTIPSWAHVARWYEDVSGPRCLPDASIRAKALELTKGAATEEEKLRKITAFVQKLQYQTTPFRMSAFVPTEGKQVLREQYGDCKDKAALLTALLGAVGIRSEMVLLSGRSSGTVPFLPSPRFNHAIARVHTAKGPLWVDASADQLEFGNLPWEDQGVPALLISSETTDLILSPTLPVESGLVADAHQTTLGADGKLAGSLELTVTGNVSWLLRSAFSSVPEAKREEAMRSFASRLLDSPKYESGALEDLDQIDKPLRLRMRYQAERFGTNAGSFLLARLPWSTVSQGSLENFAGSGPRSQDLELGMGRGRFRSTLRMELPAGYVPQDLKPETKGESPFGSYRITYRLEGSVLHGEREINILPLRVPAKEFPQLVEFLRTLSEENRRQLVFKKP
jgi:tetratricopeptide (TPR) repeat protein